MTIRHCIKYLFGLQDDFPVVWSIWLCSLAQWESEELTVTWQRQANTGAASHFTQWIVIKSHLSANQPRSYRLYSSSSTPCFLQVLDEDKLWTESDGFTHQWGAQTHYSMTKRISSGISSTSHWNEAPGQTQVPFEYIMQYDGKLHLKLH